MKASPAAFALASVCVAAAFGAMASAAVAQSSGSVASATTGSASVPGKQAQSATLVEHFERAKQFDPTFVAARASFEAAQQATNAASAMLGPKVSLSVSAFKNERVEETRNVLGQTVDFERDFTTKNAIVQARQPLFRKREFLGVDQAQAQESAAEKLFTFAEQDLHARVVSAWIDVLAARTLVSTYGEAYLAAQEIAAEADRRKRGGEGTVQDSEQAKARVSQAEAFLEDARARRDIADQALRHIVGQDAAVPANLSMAFFQSLPIAFKSEVEIVDRVEQVNAELASARFQDEAARIERDKAKSDRWPTVDAIASKSKGKNDSLLGVKDEQRIGVQLNVPLYTFGAIDASIAQADANYRRLLAQTQSTRFRVKSDALKAFNSLRALQVRVRAADQMSDASTILLKAQRIGVQAGVASRAEVAQALTELLAAQRERVQMRKEYAVAWLNLQVAVAALDAPTLDLLQSQILALSVKR